MAPTGCPNCERLEKLLTLAITQLSQRPAQEAVAVTSQLALPPAEMPEEPKLSVPKLPPEYSFIHTAADIVAK